MFDESVNFGADGDEDIDDNITNRDRQISREFTFINSLRDALGIYLKGSKTMTYEEVVDFGSQIAPAILGDDRLFFNQKKLNALYEEYRERAEALSQKEGKEISILEATIRSIREHDELIRVGQGSLVVLRRKLDDLIELGRELESSSHTETNVIMRDVYKVRRGLPYEDRKDYRDFQVPGDRGIRIRVLHPDHLEHITGADLIYECYSERYKKVRVAAIQYKIRRSSSVHIDERIEKQLDRLENTFCKRGTCLVASDLNNHNYRLPYCTAFLRPTDEVQPDAPRIMSKGFYVPVCVIKSIRANKDTPNPNAIPSKRLRDHAVTHKIFEELFNADMLGSKWITYNELEAMYQSTGFLEPHESITVHAQEFTITPIKGPRGSRGKLHSPPAM